MFFFTPAEALLAGLLALRRFGRLRGSLLAVALFAGSIYALPPVACGCLPSLRRCDTSLRWMSWVRSDLKNFASQEEIYFSDAGVYSSSAEEIGCVTSDGITVVFEATPDGWAAWGTHAALDDREGCAIFYGTPPELDALGPVAAELLARAAPGELSCTGRR